MMTYISPKGERARVFPLSPHQAVGWYQARINPQAPVYLWHLPAGVWLDGPLNVDVFTHCLGTLIQRHEVTRTTFEKPWWGKPRQRVHKSIEWTLDEEDLRGLSQDKAQEVLASRLKAKLHAPFDWKNQPLWRVGLYRLEEKKHLFFLAIHHIIADAWSQAVFFRELTVLYNAFSNGQPSPLPPIEAQYGDYVLWQQMRVKSGAVEKKFLYWENLLTPPPKFLDGLTDYSLAAPRDFSGRVKRFELPESLCQNIKQVSRSYKTTPFGFLLSNYYLLLYHRTQQENILLTIPSANRTRARFKNGMGCYAQNLPMRAQMVGSVLFSDFVAQVHQNVRQSLANQEAHIFQVFKRLKWRTLEPAQASLQIFFVYQNALVMKAQKGDMAFSLDLMWDLLDIARSAMILQLYETDDGIQGQFEYNTNLFKDETVVAFIETYLKLLDKTSCDSQETLDSIIKGL